MRTTLAIDDDVLVAARHLAESQGRTIGEAVSLLARQGLQAGASRTTTAKRNGVPLLPRRRDARPVTLDLVNQLRDEAP